jgi:hypothetical protein
MYPEMFIVASAFKQKRLKFVKIYEKIGQKLTTLAR